MASREGENIAEKDAPLMGQWARDVAATYRTLADETTWEPRRNALYTEAAKYDSIAARMDRIPRVTPAGEGRP